MRPKQFQENLDMFGSDLERWPVEIRSAAEEALGLSPELQSLLEKEKNFEKKLGSRKMEDPSPDFIQRIIARVEQEPAPRASATKKIFTLQDWFRGLWRPGPALAMAMVLILGLAIGYFSNFNGQTNEVTNLASLLYNEEGL